MLSLKLVGINVLMRKMTRKSSKFKNMRDVNAKVVILADRWIQKNFQQQGKLAYNGKKWAELAPSTILARRRRGLGAKILIDTGTMRQRWKHHYNSKSASIQSGVDYSSKHHKGHTVPERRILPEEKQLMPDIEKLFGKHIRKIIND